MRIRPNTTGSARVVGWVYAIFGGLFPISFFGQASEGAPVGEMVGVVGMQILFLVVGVGILRRANWAWWLAVAITAFMVASSLSVAGFEPVVALPLLIVFVAALVGLLKPGWEESKRLGPRTAIDRLPPPPPPPPPIAGD